MIDVVSFEGPAPGPSLLFLGGVHGDEKPGIWALDKLVTDLQRGEIALIRGRLAVAARTNAAAVARNARFVDENLNRTVTRHLAPKTHEQALANALLPHLDAADAVLDLHATSAPSAPFAFLDDDEPESRTWAQALSTRFILTGWRGLYPGDKMPTTTDYALDHGKRALTLELGLKSDIKAGDVGYRAALQTLAHFGLVPPPAAPAVMEPARRLELTQVVYRERAGEFARPWVNFDFAPAGTPIARYDDGTTLATGQDAYIVMPNAGAKSGEEWFYLAVTR